MLGGGGWPTFRGPVPPGPNVEPPLARRRVIISADVQRTALNASCMTILGGRTKQLDTFCRVTGFTSDYLSFIVVVLIRFFHGALQLASDFIPFPLSRQRCRSYTVVFSGTRQSTPSFPPPEIFG